MARKARKGELVEFSSPRLRIPPFLVVRDTRKQVWVPLEPFARAWSLDPVVVLEVNELSDRPPVTFEVPISENFTTGLLCVRRGDFLGLIGDETFALLVPRRLRANFYDFIEEVEYLLYPPKNWRTTEEELVPVPVYTFAQNLSEARELPN